MCPVPPGDEPNAHNIDEWAAYALAYLRTQLGSAAPSSLGPPTVFERSPLEGDGAAVVFPFDADPGGSGAAEPFHVVVGMTEPNYYPAYGLDADGAYRLHLGTRFMLFMGAARLERGRIETLDASAMARELVDQVAPGEPIEDLSVAAAFNVEGAEHVVLRGRVGGEEVYLMAGDAPFGFSRRVDLPAPVAYRLHIGEVLRRESEPAD